MMRERRKEMHSGDFFEKPLPERLVYQEVFLEARLNQVKGVKDAVDKLYAVLDDQQKKSADDGNGHGMWYQLRQGSWLALDDAVIGLEPCIP
jgi:hypothetical protein